VPSIHEVLALEPLAGDVFRTPPVTASLPRTFGGQVVAQALAAAVRTAPETMRPHSLHGYFLRPGLSRRPSEVQVDRLRDGTSFATRLVTVLQGGEAIFSMTASFHADESGPEHQDVKPAAPDPDGTAGFRRAHEGLERVLAADWPDWEVRFVHEAPSPDGAPEPRRSYWFRHRNGLADDPALHACALAYISDLALVATAAIPHPGPPAMLASLDHAVWLLRPFRVDEWLLYDQMSPSAGGGRGLAQGRFFDRGGRLVAVAAQEGLLRWPR
jgi:acyl-CoA thioesterase-2